MSDGDPLSQAKEQLRELLENARKGMIIPVRLPGQIEAIEALLTQAEEEKAKAAEATASALPTDVEALLKGQAEFISHAIHELRTPVTSIRGYSDMLNNPSMGELSEMQKQFLGVIRTNTRRMEGLLTDVSYMTKIRANTLRLNEKMDMAKNVLMMVQKKAEPLAEELKRKLEFLEVPSGLPILNTDGDMLSNALVKLIENALRYSPEETGTVKVSANGDGKMLNIVIEDNGIGMTPEEMAQLGTLYFRSENDLVRSYKGSGMGIPISYGIINLLGGKVIVESEPDKGTKFTVSVPGMS